MTTFQRATDQDVRGKAALGPDHRDLPGGHQGGGEERQRQAEADEAAADGGEGGGGDALSHLRWGLAGQGGAVSGGYTRVW